VTVPALKLTTYFGERDRAGDGFLCDALVDLHARHEVLASTIVRGIEGFGPRQRLQSARLLTLSEDLPLVSVAVDTHERIAALLDEAVALQQTGLVTLERAQLLDGDLTECDRLTEAPDDAASLKLTLYLGRRERAGGRPAHLAVVDALHDAGVDGATVLLGVDGTMRGERRRARVLSANADVPLMVVSVGARDRIAGALPRIASLLQRPPLATLERVRVCKRDGVRLAEPPALPDVDGGGLGVWQKLSVYASEQSRHAGRPLHEAIVRTLRTDGAAGATATRGLWGYHGHHRPHGDRFGSLRRRVPVVTVVVDRPQRIAQSFELIDELTDETGLVTSELVPALQAATPTGPHGGMRLARLG
jgi:PII-like signaling protein